MNRTLEAMARALFKSWFIDFDPVRAKATLKHHNANHSPLEGSRQDMRVQAEHGLRITPPLRWSRQDMPITPPLRESRQDMQITPPLRESRQDMQITPPLRESRQDKSLPP